MIELKPCPFCGGDAKIEDHRLVWVIKCVRCEVTILGERAPEPESEKHCDSVDFDFYKQTSIDRWNKRF